MKTELERTIERSRETRETKIQLELNLDGSGEAHINTGIGFLDHMVEQFSRHSLIDVTMKVDGDLHVDQHHTVEDVGICFGQAIRQALGNKSGIRRYGHFTLPMEEVLATVSIDLSGRYFLVFDVEFCMNLRNKKE